MDIDAILFDVDVILGEQIIPLEAYPELRVGDVLLLDQVVGDPLLVRVGGSDEFYGTPGLDETHRAVTIQSHE